MRAFITLTRRELASFFFSITGYVIIAATTFLVGLSFVVLLDKLASRPSLMPVTEMFYLTYFFWFILLLAAPIVTMRLFALEKSSGTFETLMTTPIGDLAVVMAKFLAAFVFYMVMWLPMLACVLIVQRYVSQGAAKDTLAWLATVDWGTLGAMYLGVALMGAVFISLGCFASAITRSQMVAAMVTLVLSVSLYALAFLAFRISAGGGWPSQVLSYFALFDHMHDFARGVVNTRAVVFYLSLTFFLLFLTLRAVESRRWR